MSLQHLILFCSTTSRACEPCIKFVYHHHLPVQIVRLDSQEARTRALRGKYFQIQVVPTLVVIREGGDLQLFAGQQKVGVWLQKLIAKPPPPKVSPPEPERILSDSSEEESEIPTKGLYDGKKRSSRRRRRRRKKKPRKVNPPDSEDEEIEIEFMEEPEKEPAKPPVGGLMVGPQTKKKEGVSVYDIAKQMETERKKSVWYKEEDLPVGSH